MLNFGADRLLFSYPGILNKKIPPTKSGSLTTTTWGWGSSQTSTLWCATPKTTIFYVAPSTAYENNNQSFDTNTHTSRTQTDTRTRAAHTTALVQKVEIGFKPRDGWIEKGVLTVLMFEV